MYTDDKVTAYITSKELLFNIESLDELRNLKVNFGRRLESRTRHEDLPTHCAFACTTLCGCSPGNGSWANLRAITQARHSM